MGLFEALAPRHGPDALAPTSPEIFSLTATARGAPPVSVRLSRELTGPGVRCARQTVAGLGFYGLYCAPAAHAGTRPPVLVLGGSEGGLATASTAKLLASGAIRRWPWPISASPTCRMPSAGSRWSYSRGRRAGSARNPALTPGV